DGGGKRHAMVRGDDRMGHVERRYAACAGQPVPVDLEQGSLDANSGKGFGKGFAMLPVDGAAIAVEQPRMRQDERSAGDAADAHAVAGEKPETAEGRTLAEGRRVAAGADEEEVQVESVPDGVVGEEPQPV